MKDTAQQASLNGKLVILFDIVEYTQGGDGAVELCRTSTAQRVGANARAPFFQRLYRSLGGQAFFLPGLLAFLLTCFQLLQPGYLALLPQFIALIFAQAGCADTAQVLYIARSPEIEDGVIANDERRGDGQQFSRNAPKRVLERFPRRIGDYRGSMHIHA